MAIYYLGKERFEADPDLKEKVLSIMKLNEKGMCQWVQFPCSMYCKIAVSCNTDYFKLTECSHDGDFQLHVSDHHYGHVIWNRKPVVPLPAFYANLVTISLVSIHLCCWPNLSHLFTLTLTKPSEYTCTAPVSSGSIRRSFYAGLSFNLLVIGN